MIFFTAKVEEALYSQHKQDQELTGSDHQLLIAQYRLILKKGGKTTRPFRYDLNQIPYDGSDGKESACNVGDPGSNPW